MIWNGRRRSIAPIACLLVASAAPSTLWARPSTPVETPQSCTVINQQDVRNAGRTTIDETIQKLPASPTDCPPPPPSQPSTNLSPLGRDALEAHNVERAAVGAPPLRWNDELAAGANSWAAFIAKAGDLIHSPREGRGDVRENLAKAPVGMPFTQVFGLWSAEKADFSQGIFPNVARDGDPGKILHYTQEIWPTTTDIGCGVAQGGGFNWFVCRYSPGGNKDGKPVGQPVQIASNPPPPVGGNPAKVATNDEKPALQFVYVDKLSADRAPLVTMPNSGSPATAKGNALPIQYIYQDPLQSAAQMHWDKVSFDSRSCASDLIARAALRQEVDKLVKVANQARGDASYARAKDPNRAAELDRLADWIDQKVASLEPTLKVCNVSHFPILPMQPTKTPPTSVAQNDSSSGQSTTFYRDTFTHQNMFNSPPPKTPIQHQNLFTDVHAANAPPPPPDPLVKLADSSQQSGDTKDIPPSLPRGEAVTPQKNRLQTSKRYIDLPYPSFRPSKPYPIQGASKSPTSATPQTPSGQLADNATPRQGIQIDPSPHKPTPKDFEYRPPTSNTPRTETGQSADGTTAPKKVPWKIVLVDKTHIPLNDSRPTLPPKARKIGSGARSVHDQPMVVEDPNASSPSQQPPTLPPREVVTPNTLETPPTPTLHDRVERAEQTFNEKIKKCERIDVEEYRALEKELASELTKRGDALRNARSMGAPVESGQEKAYQETQKDWTRAEDLKSRAEAEDFFQRARDADKSQCPKTDTPVM